MNISICEKCKEPIHKQNGTWVGRDGKVVCVKGMHQARPNFEG